LKLIAAESWTGGGGFRLVMPKEKQIERNVSMKKMTEILHL
jgi:hypothetical protein